MTVPALSLPVGFCTVGSTSMLALGLGPLFLEPCFKSVSSCCATAGLWVPGVGDQSTVFRSHVPEPTQMHVELSPPREGNSLQEYGGREVDNEIGVTEYHVRDTHKPNVTSMEEALFGIRCQVSESRHWYPPAGRCVVVYSLPLMGKTNLLSTHGASDDRDVGGTGD